MDLKIIHEDKDILVAVKPSGMPSQPDKTGDEDFLSKIITHTGIEDIGLIHRLDRPVGGLMLFGKTKKATEILNRYVSGREITKTYLAVVCGQLTNETGTLENYLVKNQKLNMSKVVQKGAPNSKLAILDYTVLETIKDENGQDLTLVKIHLKTGRHHQIRVQFAHNNTPLWGDNKYNENFKRTRGNIQIGLWSYGLSLQHPISKKTYSFQVRPKDGIFKNFEKL